MGKNIKDEFDAYFRMYQKEKFKGGISYVQTSGYRAKPAGTPHSIKDNAMDCTLRSNGDFASIHEYKYLMKWMMDRWPYRMGLDMTPNVTQPGFPGNVHIHLDLGGGRPQGQAMPFFFIEDNGKFQRQVKTKEDIA